MARSFSEVIEVVKTFGTAMLAGNNSFATFQEQIAGHFP
jgi:hypothetical protein